MLRVSVSQSYEHVRFVVTNPQNKKALMFQCYIIYMNVRHPPPPIKLYMRTCICEIWHIHTHTQKQFCFLNFLFNLMSRFLYCTNISSHKCSYCIQLFYNNTRALRCRTSVISLCSCSVFYCLLYMSFHYLHCKCAPTAHYMENAVVVQYICV